MFQQTTSKQIIQNNKKSTVNTTLPLTTTKSIIKNAWVEDMGKIPSPSKSRHSKNDKDS